MCLFKNGDACVFTRRLIKNEAGLCPRLIPPRPAAFMRRPPVLPRAGRERPVPQAQMGPNGPFQAAPLPTRHLYRGEYLPDGGFGAPIQNPDRFHLRRAPPGYYWVRRGGDMLLITTAAMSLFALRRRAPRVEA